MIKKPLLYFLLICTINSEAYSQNIGSEKSGKTDLYDGIEFKMPVIQEPEIQDYVVNITDFGAVSGGRVLNTQAFADAIEDVTKKGGGKVVIPAGIWLTGPVILKSNLELYTEPGALIVFTKDKDQYPLVKTSFEGLNTWRCISPIYGKDVENIAFTGHGIWDGSGDAWRFVKKSKLTTSQWRELVASGGVLNDAGDEWFPSEQFRKAYNSSEMNVPLNLKTKEDFESVRDFLRPVMVSIQNSKRILIDGATFQNSPAWCIHPLIVEDLVVKNTTIRNPWYSQNGDGIDIESCKNVLIYNSNFDVGDDAICIKSGKDEQGRLRGIPCENLIIKNNIVYHGHGGVTVGSEMSGGVKNMHVSNCTFIGTDVGLRFKSNRGRGGVVEDIFISDIFMTDIPTYAISFNLYYGGQSVSELFADGGSITTSEKEPVTEETPQFKNISIRNISLKGAYQAVLLQGLPEMNLENVVLSDLTLEAENGFSVFDANGVKIKNVKLYTENERAIEIFNCKNIEINNLEYGFKSPKSITINGSDSEKIKLISSPNQKLKNFTSIGDEVRENEVTF
ncbi:MAG: glycoside hydrolase family 28 protein [Prolixibacteraceae bacterium]|nr:glycoside hydrolase family 28 protein [Prolixibacteraceae bacterium]MBN2772977.1 glycoside hydrolase family 28 protein [Prolixibacteraceae bacterium]